MKQKNEPLTAEEKKTITTTFVLLFPALTVAIIASMYSPVAMKMVVVLLSVYQFLLIKKFTEDYHHKNN